jgi:two-component system NtrC family sensor kinase
MQQRRFPIRTKLTLATMLPLSVAILICTIASFSILLAKIGAQAQDKVRGDLNAAHEIYQHEISHLQDIARFTAAAPFVADAMAKMNGSAVSAVIDPLLQSEKLDIFTAVDASGAVLFRAQNPAVHGDDLSRDFLVMKALKGEPIAGTTVLTRRRLESEGESVAGRAVIKAVPTEHERASGKAVEETGMFMIAAAPVKNRSGSVVGALYCGTMLNNNNELVDRIKATVYEGARNEVGDAGSATLLLNDLRIATNVNAADNRRAVGTRLSEEVYNRVVLMKEKWIDRAFVVNDWYFSAYEPIISIEGAPIGALYVGTLEKPFTQLKTRMIALTSGVLMFGSLIGILVARAAASRLARPIKELESLASRVAAGERGVRIQKQSEDEIGDLADEFNRMSAALTDQEKEIRELNRDLEEKVRIRTAELEEKSAILVQTQQELSRAERLAAIGELAAGVAHEINNPLAIIRGNAELVQMALPPDSASQEEIGIIARQVGRVERIVSNLLKFARREKKSLSRTSIRVMLDEILDQIRHQVPLDNISIQRDLADGAEVEGDADQLRQVFTNLVLNAIQSMPDGGVLTVSATTDSLAGNCEIMVRDTGNGICEENLDKIFNPFFTTRPDGTGLGLSVSYGIVRDHGGEILVESAPGKGTVFRVRLPLRQPDQAGSSVPVPAIHL